MYRCVLGGSLAEFFKTKASSPPPAKRQRIVPPPSLAPRPQEQKSNEYDSISRSLQRAIDEWIVLWNRQTIEEMRRELFGSRRRSDVFCLIGPTGSGKTVLLDVLLKGVRRPEVDFADFAVMDESKQENRGYLSTLMEDAKPCVVVFDSLDTVANVAGTVHLIKREYEERKLGPNKAVVLTLQSTKDFVIREWMRETRAYSYRMRDRLFGSEQNLLVQSIQSAIALRSDEPIREFHGDFRRMGIDLVACTHEGSKYGRNTGKNSARTATLFDMASHLLTWPATPLHHSLVFADETSSLRNMCAGNHTNRVADSNKVDIFDELVRSAADLSDVDWLGIGGGDFGDDHGLTVIPNNNGVHVDTDNAGLFLLCRSFYESNKRLGRVLLSKQRVEFVRSIPQTRPLSCVELDDPTKKIFDEEKKEPKRK